MAKAQYTEKEAKSKLTRNGAKIRGKRITILEPGLKLLGAIDYLVNKHKYSWFTEKP